MMNNSCLHFPTTHSWQYYTSFLSLHRIYWRPYFQMCEEPRRRPLFAILSRLTCVMPSWTNSSGGPGYSAGAENRVGVRDKVEACDVGAGGGVVARDDVKDVDVDIALIWTTEFMPAGYRWQLLNSCLVGEKGKSTIAPFHVPESLWWKKHNANHTLNWPEFQATSYLESQIISIYRRWSDRSTAQCLRSWSKAGISQPTLPLSLLEGDNWRQVLRVVGRIGVDRDNEEN